MKKVFLIVMVLFSGIAIGQPPKNFFAKFGGNGIDIGYSVKQTLDGQYIVAGSTTGSGAGNTDFFLLKIDSMGQVIWQKTYGGFNNDVARSVIQLADSGYVITGFTNSFGNGGYDVMTIRTDKNGTLIWLRASGGLDWDFGYEVKQSPDMLSIFICGSTNSFGFGKMDGYVLKYDLNGNLLKQKTFGGAEDDEFKSFTFTYNNLIAFAGTTKSYGDIKGDCWLMKTNMNGDSTFSLKYGDNKKQLLNDIVEAPNHDFVFAGATDINGRDSTWAYLLSLDENGNFKYDNNFPRSELYNNYQFSTLTNGNYFNNYVYVHKNFNSPAGYKLEPAFYFNIGKWPNVFSTYGSLDDDEIYDIAKTRDKGYISVGYTKGFNSIHEDIFLIKLDSTILGTPNFVGIKENLSNKENDIIFPTITKDMVCIQTSKSNLTLIVRNNLGEILFETAFNEKYSLNLKSYNTGIYFISLQNSNFLNTYKVIKTE